MAVVASIVYRGLTPEQYDRVREEVDWIENAPTGGITHVVWWEGDDCHIIDGWESEEDFASFGEDRLQPGVAKVGVDIEPEITVYAAHEIYTPKSVALT